MGCEKTRGGGLRRGAPVVIRAQRKVHRSRQRAHQQRLRSKLRHSYYGFLYISAVRVVSIPTPYYQIFINTGFQSTCALNTLRTQSNAIQNYKTAALKVIRQYLFLVHLFGLSFASFTNISPFNFNYFLYIFSYVMFFPICPFSLLKSICKYFFAPQAVIF